MSEVENQGPTDDELLNDVLSDEETTDSPVVAEQVEQTQDEPGTVEAQAEDGTTERPPIPPKPEWRLKEDAERARAAESELARERAEGAALRQRLDALERSNRPKQEQANQPARPDPLLDPEGYAKQVREDIRNELLAERREESLQAALEEKPEEFKAAYQAAQQTGDPALKARMQAARNPGKELLKWHKEQRVKAEVGDDLEAYVEKKVQERLAAQQQPNGQTQQNNGRPRVALPPSLNGASRANTTLRSNVDDVSDDQLFQEIAG